MATGDQEFMPDIAADPTPPRRPSVDRSKAYLFEGLGNALEGFVETVDNHQQTRIATELSQGLADENQKWFNAAGINTSDFQDTTSRMTKLKEAYESGAISDTLYYGNLTSLVKKLKARHPGRIKQIDDLTGEVLGFDPANKLRSTLSAEIDAQTSSAQKREAAWDSFLRRDDVMGVLANTPFADVYSNPEKYQTEEERGKVMSAISLWKGQEAKADFIKKRLDADDAAWKKEGRQLQAQFVGISTGMVEGRIAGLGKVIEGQSKGVAAITGGKGIFEYLETLSANPGKADARAMQMLTQSLVAERTKLRNQISQMATKTFAGHATPEEMNKIIDEALAPFDSILHSIKADDYQLASYQKRLTDAAVEAGLFQEMSREGSPAVALQVLAKSYGSEGLGMLIVDGKFPELQENAISMVDALKHITPVFDPEGFGKGIGSDGAGNSYRKLSTSIQQIKDNENWSDEYQSLVTRNTIEMATGIFLAPNADPTAKANSVRFMFSDGGDWLQDVNEESQVYAFKNLTDPRIAKSIRDMNDPESWETYKSFALEGIQRLDKIRLMTQDVNTIQQTGDWMNAVVGPDGKVHVTIDENGFLDAMDDLPEGQVAMKVTALRNTIKYTSELNSVLSNTTEILKLDGAQDVPGEVSDILKMASVNLDARQGGFLEWLTGLLTGPEGTGGGAANLDQRTAREGRRETGVGGMTLEEGGDITIEEFLQKHPDWLRLEKKKLPEAVSRSQNEVETLELRDSILDIVAQAQGRMYDKDFVTPEESAPEPQNATEAIAAQTGEDPYEGTPTSALQYVTAVSEGTIGRANADEYDETLGYGMLTGGDKTLTTMTLDEIDQLQSQMLVHPSNRWDSSAVGKFQITRRTLRDLRKQLGLKGTEKFDKRMQDRLSVALLQRRGYTEWLNGSLTTDKFVANMQNEWEGFKTAEGEQRLRDMLDNIRNGDPRVKARSIETPSSYSKYITAGNSPMFDMSNPSKMTKDYAGHRMATLMQNDFIPVAEAFEAKFGKPLTINDAIAKAGTSRESETPKSQHFHGNALDISTRGMTNTEKLELVRMLRAQGFTGFGFGNTILHADKGPRRAWAYKNPTYGGVSTAVLTDAIKRGLEI